VTPWLAAGLGVLIAATAALEAPRHIVLSYGPIDPGVRCRVLRCASAAPGRGRGSLATAKPGIELPPPSPTGAPDAQVSTAPLVTPAAPLVTPGAPLATPGATPAFTPAASPAASPAARSAPDVTLRYLVIRKDDAGFVGVITVQSRQQLGDWSLRFTIPGDRISNILGAQWMPSASGDGGVAKGQPWPWPRSGPKMAKIVIFASGTPHPPASCSFDGKSCRFG
jgi:hypothetical protein